MGHTKITSDLPYSHALLHVTDLHGIPVAVAVVKATFKLGEQLTLAEEQPPILPAGEAYGKPGESSYRYEPEIAFFKPATDIVLIGSAIPQGGADVNVKVRFSVGPYSKAANVFGDRFWVRSFGGSFLSAPEPFESMPLIYERAFGGRDISHSDSERHRFEPRNPVGAGFSVDFARGQDRIPLPNIEDPADPITSMKSRPKPIGFGFISPNWQPRARLAGTYDAEWFKHRMPLLPSDFDLRFFNAASEGLVTDGFLAGNEPVHIENCSALPIQTFHLPGIPPPICRFRIAGELERVLNSNLDTLIVNTTDNLVSLTWRCHLRIPRGPEMLLAMQLSAAA